MGASATADARPHICDYRINAKLYNPYAANLIAATNSSAPCRTVPAQGLHRPVDARGFSRIRAQRRHDDQYAGHRALCDIEAPNVFSQGWPLSAGVGYTDAIFLQRGERVIAHDRSGHGPSTQPDDGHDGPLRRRSCGLDGASLHMGPDGDFRALVAVDAPKGLADLAPSRGSRNRNDWRIIGAMKRDVGAELEVEITAPTTLEFQIAVAPHPKTEVSESLSFVLDGNPFQPLEISGVHGNRIHKLDVPVGNLTVAYAATIVGQTDPAPVTEYDLSMYLRPSRYAEADKFYGFAATEFGNYIDSTTLLEKVSSSGFGTRLNYVPGSSDPIDGAVWTPCSPVPGYAATSCTW